MNNYIKQCPECKKYFSLKYYNTKDYSYQDRETRTYYCSYTCYNAVLTRIEQKHKRRIKMEDTTLIL